MKITVNISSMNKILLFDFDGTLADSIEIVTISFKDTFQEMKEEYPGDTAIQAEIGKHLQDIFAKFVPDHRIEEAVQCYRKYYLFRQERGEVHSLPGVISVIRDLKEKGYRMGIVTTKLRKYTQPLVDQFGLLDCFEIIVGAEDVKKCKPNPEPLFTAVKKMNVSVDECVYIGDAVHDGEAAKAAGMEFIAVLTGAGKKEELEKFGEIFENLGDLSTIL